MLRVVLSLIADACTSPLDAYYCVLRASGLTFRAIARRDGQMSHQAVHKRLRAICRREPVLLEYLCHDRRQNARMKATTNQPPTTDQPDKEPTDA